MKHDRLVGIAVAAAVLWSSTAAAGTLQPFERGSWKSILEAHAGHPVVVHFWGLSCAPCRKEMPHWGRLLQTHPDAPIVTINADIVPNSVEDAQAFLDQSGLSGAENWIFQDSFVERLRREIDPRWQGEIPLTLLIGRDGTRTTIEGAAPATVILDWLEAQASETR